MPILKEQIVTELVTHGEPTYSGYGLVFTGTQFIDTGLTIKSTLRVVLDMVTTLALQSSVVGCVGGRTGTSASTGTHFVFLLGTNLAGTSNQGSWTYGNPTGTSPGNPAILPTRSQIPVNQRLLIDLNRNELKVNGTLIGSAEASNFNETPRVGLGRFDNNGTWFATGMQGRVYSCQIYDDDVLVRDFVPVPQNQRLDGKTGIDAPVNFVRTVKSGASNTFRWNAVNGATNYQMQRNSDLTFNTWQDMTGVTGTATTYTATFTALSEYRIRLRVEVGGVWSDWTDSIGFMQNAPDHNIAWSDTGEQPMMPAPSNCMWDNVGKKYFQNDGTGTFDIVEDTNAVNQIVRAYRGGKLVYQIGTTNALTFPCEGIECPPGYRCINGVCVPENEFIPVDRIASIDGFLAYVGLENWLFSVVFPRNATMQEIEWSLVDAGTTGAVVIDNILFVSDLGNVRVRGRVIGGLGECIDYTQDFTLTVVTYDGAYVSVTDIPNIPKSLGLTVGNTCGYHPGELFRELPIDVVPTNATCRHIFWNVLGNDGITEPDEIVELQSSISAARLTIYFFDVDEYEHQWRYGVCIFQIPEEGRFRYYVGMYFPDFYHDWGWKDEYSTLYHQWFDLDKWERLLAGFGGQLPQFSWFDMPNWWQKNVTLRASISNGTEGFGLVFTGTQHINTGINGNSDLRIVIDVTPIEAQATSNINCPIYGVRDGTNLNTSSNSFIFWYRYNSTITDASVIYGGTQQRIIPANTPWDIRCTLDQNRNLTYRNGVLVTTHPSTAFSISQPVLLGAVRNGDGTMYINKLGGIVYSCQIYDNDVLVRDFVPVPQGSTAYSSFAAPSNCMWDKKSQTYFQNDGTGTFGIISDGMKTYEQDTILYMEFNHITDTSHLPQLGLAWGGTIIAQQVNSIELPEFADVWCSHPKYGGRQYAINWEILNDGGTGATLLGGSLQAMNPGTITLIGSVLDYNDAGETWTTTVSVFVSPYIPVSDVLGIDGGEVMCSDSMYLGTSRVMPLNATATSVLGFQLIWDVGDYGGGTLSEDGVFTAPKTLSGDQPVTVTLTGRVRAGLQYKPTEIEFVVTVSITILPFIPVVDIMGLPGGGQAGILNRMYFMPEAISTFPGVRPSRENVTFRCISDTGAGTFFAVDREGHYLGSDSKGEAVWEAVVVGGKNNVTKENFVKQFSVTMAHVPVSGLDGSVPGQVCMGEPPVALPTKVKPITGTWVDNATRIAVTWDGGNSVGAGCPVFTDSNPPQSYTVERIARVIGGMDTNADVDWVQPYAITIANCKSPPCSACIPVTDIVRDNENCVPVGSVPSVTVLPSNATNKSISWSVISGTVAAGNTVSLRATIVGGLCTSNFLKTFSVTYCCTPVTGIVRNNDNCVPLGGFPIVTVQPSNASYRTVNWSTLNVVQGYGYGYPISGTVRATITRGACAGDFIQDFPVEYCLPPTPTPGYGYGYAITPTPTPGYGYGYGYGYSAVPTPTPTPPPTPGYGYGYSITPTPTSPPTPGYGYGYSITPTPTPTSKPTPGYGYGYSITPTPTPPPTSGYGYGYGDCVPVISATVTPGTFNVLITPSNATNQTVSWTWISGTAPGMMQYSGNIINGCCNSDFYVGTTMVYVGGYGF